MNKEKKGCDFIVDEKKPIYRKVFRFFKRIAYIVISVLRIFSLIKIIFERKGD